MNSSKRKGPTIAKNNSSKTEDPTQNNAFNIARPKRFLTAYNFFFMKQRAALLGSDGEESKSSSPMAKTDHVVSNSSKPWAQKKTKRLHVKTHGKIDFESLGKLVAAKWKALSPDERKVYDDLAKEDLERYRREREEYKQKVVLMIEQREATEYSSKDSEEDEHIHTEKSMKKPCHDIGKRDSLKWPDEAKSTHEKKVSHSKKRSLNSLSKCNLVASPPVPLCSGKREEENNIKKSCSKFREEEDETTDTNAMSILVEKIAPSCALSQKKTSDPAIRDCVLNGNGGKKRSSTHFNFQTKKLYERDQHVSTIMGVYRRLVQSKSMPEIVMISGYPGAGKSALVHHVIKTMPQMGKCVLSGKFDQFRQMEPLSAITDALTDFCNNIPRNDAMKLREIVGTEVDILADVIPAFRQAFRTTATSSKTTSSNTSAEEAHHRLKFAFRRFFRAITTPNKPLILFLDDMQWADLLSLDLVESLITDEENKSFLLLGCYRDNKVNETYALLSRLRTIESNGVTVTNINSGNLSRKAVNELTSDILHTSPNLTEHLSCAIHRKTDGNILFVLEFLRSIYNEGILYFQDHPKQWKWDISIIEAKKLADSVVDLMSYKILNLPYDTQYVLKVMACMGSESEEWVLHAIMAEHGVCDGESRRYITCLDLAVKEGLINRVVSKYKFAHDHFQHAAYSLIPENSRGHLHLWIGSKVWANRAASPEKALFISVGQLNKGAIFITDKKQRLHAARLNLQAGEKSMSLAAFIPAAFYLKMAISLLDENSWSDHYDLCLRLYSLYAEANYCNGEFQDLGIILSTIFTNAKCALDKVRAYRTSISALFAQSRVKEAFNHGLDALSQIGEPTPMHGNKKLLIMVEFAKAKKCLEGKNDIELLVLKKMEDEQKIAAMNLMSSLALTAFFSDQEMYALLTLRMVQISLNDGLCNVSAFGFASFGCLLVGILSDICGADRFGKLSLRLLEKSQATECLPAVYVLVYSVINSLIEHHRVNIKPLEDACKVGLQLGKCNYAMCALVQTCIFSFYCGENLATVEKKMKDSCKEMMKHNQKMFTTMLLPYRQACLNLIGRSDDPEQLVGEAMDQDELLEGALENKNLRLVASIHRIRCWLAYLFGNYKSASKLLEEMQAPDVKSSATMCYALFVSGLISFATAHEKDQSKWSALGAKSVDELGKYAFHAPSNYKHMLLLLQAESAFLSGEHDDAGRYYDEAIQIADENGFVQDQALAQERAGIFYSKKGKHATACDYYRKAYDAYQKWGAHCKANHLRQRYYF